MRLRKSRFAGGLTSFGLLSNAFVIMAERIVVDERWNAHGYALGASEGEARLNVSANAQSSSLLDIEARTVHAEPTAGQVDVETVQVRRLDTLWSELPEAAKAAPLLLKLDVQGFEPQVLEGAAGVIGGIEAVFLEASLTPVYQGEMVLEQMLGLMRGLGFHPVWMRPGWSDAETGQTYQVDMLFSRQISLPRH